MRIFPAYAFTLWMYLMFKSQRKYCMDWGWSNLLFLNNVVGPQIVLGSCMNHTWSIAVEFQFYVVSPILALLMQRSSSHARALHFGEAEPVPVAISSAKWRICRPGCSL